jgi:hypothetical protein
MSRSPRAARHNAGVIFEANATNHLAAPKVKRRAGSNLSALLLDIEQPLRDATLTVEALRLVGHGLVLHDSTGGDAVAELGRIAAERLQVVEDMLEEGVGGEAAAEKA